MQLSEDWRVEKVEAEEIKSWLDEYIDAKEKINELIEFNGISVSETCFREIFLNTGFEEVANAIGAVVNEFDFLNSTELFFFYRGFTINTFVNKKSSDNTDQSTVTTNA